MQRKKKLVARAYYDPTTHRVEVIRFEETSAINQTWLRKVKQ